MSNGSGPWSNIRWLWLGLIIFYFILCGWKVHVHGLHGRDGTRIDEGMKAGRQRQYEALGRVLLANIGSWQSCGWYTYHLCKP